MTCLALLAQDPRPPSRLHAGTAKYGENAFLVEFDPETLKPRAARDGTIHATVIYPFTLPRIDVER